MTSTRCPICDRLIVNFCNKDGCVYPGRPALSSRARLSDDVPSELAVEYHTAAQVIPYSPEASAAISRRLLHRFLESHVGAGGGSLAERIEAATSSGELPPYLRDALDTLAQVARLDVDDAKSARPDVLAPTQPGEPEWLLDVLDQLFDLYFVQPARLQRKRARLEEQVGPLVPAPAVLLETPEESEAPAYEGESASAESDEEIPATDPAEETPVEDADQPAAATETVAQPVPPEGSTPAETDRGGWRRLTGR